MSGIVRRGRLRQGFTLLEVVVALGVLIVGLLGLLAMQINAMRFGARGRHTSAAAVVAEDAMEQLQRLPFTDPNLATTAPNFVFNNTVVSTVQADQGAGTNHTEQTFTVTRRITNVNANMKAIDVRVTWSEPNRPNRTHTISSARHNDPL